MGLGLGFSYVEDGEAQYTVTIVKDTGQGPGEIQAYAGTEAPVPAAGDRGPVVLVTSDSMGRGSEELGRLLIKGFIFSLGQLNPLPEAVIFLNGGAYLTTEGANTVGDLKALADRGTEIYTCGTCANYYKLAPASRPWKFRPALRCSPPRYSQSSFTTAADKAGDVAA